MTKETYVAKAAITLGSQESLDTFSRRVSDAVSLKFGTPNNPTTGQGVYVWTRSVFPDKVVFEKNPMGQPIKLYSVDYKAAPDSVEFTSEPIEVREVRTYEPVTTESKGVILKSEDESQLGDLWKGLNL